MRVVVPFGEVAIDMDELFGRARRVSLDGPEVLTLDPADTLLQLAVHAGLSGGAKLAWLKDIDRAAADPDTARATRARPDQPHRGHPGPGRRRRTMMAG